MAVAELFIGAFITVLFEKLASGDLIKLARSAGIYSELNKWNDILTQIRAVLSDAGQKQIRDKPVELWLNRLQHLAYEIDDVLDDLATEAMRRRCSNQESNASSSTSKVIKNITAKFNALKYGHKMSSKLDGITNKLQDLLKEKTLLGLNDDVEVSVRSSRRLKETSLVDVSKIVGRDDDKEALLGKLLCNESSSSQNVDVVSIIGMGGIGKTTLAQLLYNDKKVKDHFKLMSWVCVSDKFDVFSISKTIFQAVGGGNQDFADLNLLQVALTEKLSKKKFLLVLDDVWNENYQEWELLQRPFNVGAPGSKVLVTTRKAMVASVMDSVQDYALELLSNQEALSLFAQHALGEQNFDSHPTLKLYGEGIVKKCRGLPLALRTLGRMLRTKSNDEEWEDLLNSEIWDLQDGNEIPPALRLSYYDLPAHLKQMFAYCCLFPKDYVFYKDEPILLWMAEGFLYESRGSKSMESLGRECFQELVSRSFFQRSINSKSQYTMHDLVNDLATSVAGEFFYMLGDKMDFDANNEALEKLYHLSFIHQSYEDYKRFKALQSARHLRTFLPVSVRRLSSLGEFYLSKKVLIELLPQLQFLRVLSLVNYKIEEVPKSIIGLKHLRYLNFSNTEITCLPEQVGALCNLQSLLLSGCDQLCSLPNSIVKLINLRHLDINDTPELHKLPSGICELKDLQTLSKVIINGADEFKVSDLKNLLQLEGQLSIEGLDKVRNAVEAKEANLHQKKGLHDLEMKWSDVFDDSRNERTEYEVLEGLRPFEKLTGLKIVHYMGTTFPSWVGGPSFVCLTQLTLRGCRRCTKLPTLGHLQSLQKLFVESMDGLKRVGSELLGPPNTIAFPSLEVLVFKDMEGWEEWSSGGGNRDVSMELFPCLHEISLINCPKLDVVAIELIPSVRDLSIEGCSVGVMRSMAGVCSSIRRLRMVNIKGLSKVNGELVEHMKWVEDLWISECNELEYMWESEVEACEILVNLKKLEVRECENLVLMGEKKVRSSMESVREVCISKCGRLESFRCPNSSIERLRIESCNSMTSLTFPTLIQDEGFLPCTLETLTISNCNSMTSLTFPTLIQDEGFLPSTLKSLHIEHCDAMEVSWLPNTFMASLESLFIWRIPNLRLFPEGCLLHLTSLDIFDCDSIESIPDEGFGFLPSLCLRRLCISNCKNLKSFPHEDLQSLTSLEEMSIRNCPSMEESFPSGKWPPNLRELRIGGLKKAMSEWGIQNFPNSLVELWLEGENSGVVRFGEISNNINNTSSSPFLLPSSLTTLRISDFEELESVSKGLQHLTSFQHLDIDNCPKLRDLPETLLPSLSSLWIVLCPKLRKKCARRKGKYSRIISHIPNLKIGE